MKPVIFLGPSLPLSEAREILDAVYLPPAKQADIVSAIGIHHPSAIGLIDGEFGQALSVWHKEILYALEQGIPVFGASSMGALRAAELAEFGMVGVGDIYRMYASGELMDDDEVALAHGCADTGYRPLSEPMVNIRATLSAARRAGLLDAEQCQSLTALARGMFYPERSYVSLFRAAAASGVSRDILVGLRDFVATSRVDLKRLDAMALLRAVRDIPRPGRAHQATFTLERTRFFETLYHRDRRVRHDGVDLPLESIVNYAALHLAGFTELNAHALNRVLTGVLADLVELQVSDDDIQDEAKRFMLARGVTDPSGIRAWLDRNDLDVEEFRSLVRDLARTRALRRWLVNRQITERSAKFVLDELRCQGLYEEVARQAAAQEAMLADHYPHFTQACQSESTTEQLAIDHMRATRCRMDTAYDVWAEEVGFHSSDDLRVELLRARLARQAAVKLAGAATAAMDDALVPV